VRFDELQVHYDKWERIQIQIEADCDTEQQLQQAETDRILVENSFYATKAGFLDILDALKPQPATPTQPGQPLTPGQVPVQLASVKLPTPDLRRFDGRYEDWISCW